MTWLGLVDDVLKVAFNNGDDVLKVLSRYGGDGFADELIRGLDSQRNIGRLVRGQEIAKLIPEMGENVGKLAQANSNALEALGRRMRIGPLAGSGNQFIEAAEHMRSAGLDDAIGEAIKIAKQNRLGKGLGGATGHGLGRVINRASAAWPSVKTMGVEGLVGTATIGLPLMAMSALTGGGSSNQQQSPQVAALQEAVMSGQLTPEEAEEIFALQQAGYV